MKNKKFYFRIILFIIALLIMFSSNVFADMGIKPSITINLQNMNTDDYLIDLLIYDKTGRGYASEMNCNDINTLTEEQIRTLHEINYDGWISASTRWGYTLLMSDVLGNRMHSHDFGYFGTPEVYRVVIVYGSGDIRISDIITRTEVTSTVDLDVKTMKFIEQRSLFDFNTIKKMIICILITIIVEISVANILSIFKEVKLKNIITVNFVSQLFLHILISIVPTAYMIKFCILEVIILFMEFYLYKLFGYNSSKGNLIKFVFVANILTATLTFFIV